MALETEQNHYQVLGVERTADERAVKKAYFGLVRTFPPDQHPEEFKKIRAAYEVLSDPVARRRFDSLDRDYAEHGESEGAALRAAADAIKSGDEAKAREHLRALLSRRPDLLEAREMLGHSLMRGGDCDGGLAQFVELVRAKPEDGRYHLWRGYALEAKNQEAVAEGAFRRACELRPDDVETRMALARVLASRRSHDEALAQVREALGRLPDEPGPRLQVSLRLVDVLFLKGAVAGGPAPALRELDALVARVCRDPDRELWRFASSQLAGLAASLFAREAFEAGNAVLARCRRLNPSSLVEHPYPERSTLPVAALPERARRWLAARRPGPTSPTFLLSRWGATLWGFLAAAALAMFTAFVLFASPWAWGGAGYAFAAILIVGSAVALAASARAVVAAASSPLRPLVTVHPLYLVQTTAREATVYSLVHLRGVTLTRHTTNGVYTHTVVEAKFGERTYRTSIRNEAYAKGWADHLLATRRRLLELLSHGFLEAEPEVGVLPPRLLQKEDGRKRWRPRVDRWVAAGAAAGLLLFAAAIPLNRRLVDEKDFAAAVSAGTLRAHGAYLARHPSGRFAGAARGERARIHERARADFAVATLPGAAGPSALLEGLRAMEKAGQDRLPVTVAWEADEQVAAAEAGDDDLRVALANPVPARDLAGRLGLSLQRAGLGPVVRAEARPVEPSTALGLVLRARYGMGPDDLEAGPLRLRSLRMAWRAELVGAGKAALFTWEAETTPEVLEVPAPGPVADSGWRRSAYRAEIDAACDELSDRLAEALGLPANGEREGPRPRSPYGPVAAAPGPSRRGRP